MHSRMKITRRGDEISLAARNGGRAFAWLLLLEVTLLAVLIAHLAGVVDDWSVLAWPVAAALALVAWTIVQMKPDYRITMDLATRQGRVTCIAPITGARTTSSFALDEVDSLALQQTVSRAFWNEYVVAVELRGGDRLVVSERGPLLAYQDEVSRFSRAAGIGSRVVRLAAS